MRRLGQFSLDEFYWARNSVARLESDALRGRCRGLTPSALIAPGSRLPRTVPKTPLDTVQRKDCY